ncbi:MAG: hypothetical protein KatS3mg124_1932 [Porticoccaceae bacterium]|nr:MAG: hypothetical protein KatS3mg124_1932 [Porticoccaceae bacterium]
MVGNALIYAMLALTGLLGGAIAADEWAKLRRGPRTDAARRHRAG